MVISAVGSVLRAEDSSTALDGIDPILVVLVVRLGPLPGPYSVPSAPAPSASTPAPCVPAPKPSVPEPPPSASTPILCAPAPIDIVPV